MITSSQLRVHPFPSDYLREDILLNPDDARQFGFDSGARYGIWSRQPLFIGSPDERHAVRIAFSDQAPRGTLLVNQNFLDHIGYAVEDSIPWSIDSAAQLQSVRGAVLEMVTEQALVAKQVENFRRNRKEIFENRCLLVEPEKAAAGVAIPTKGQAYLNIRSIDPDISSIHRPTVLVFEETTSLSLFVPHRRSGVDVVLVVDGSNSMNLRDYVGADGRPSSRLRGAQEALDRLFEQRLVSGTRISRIAAIVFGRNTSQLYPRPERPEDRVMAEVTGEEQLPDMKESVRYLNDVGLTRIGLDRNGTDISQAIKEAADLLDLYFREGNEKLIVLLSDGADWRAEQDVRKGIELVSASSDPAVLAESLHHESDVRFCTVAISNADNVRRYEPSYVGKAGWTPNTELLRRMAQSTDGLFFDQPDARALKSLLDKLGQGSIYNL